jgi:hypothetical protein
MLGNVLEPDNCVHFFYNSIPAVMLQRATLLFMFVAPIILSISDHYIMSVNQKAACPGLAVVSIYVTDIIRNCKDEAGASR